MYLKRQFDATGLLIREPEMLKNVTEKVDAMFAKKFYHLKNIMVLEYVVS